MKVLKRSLSLFTACLFCITICFSSAYAIENVRVQNYVIDGRDVTQIIVYDANGQPLQSIVDSNERTVTSVYKTDYIEITSVEKIFGASIDACEQATTIRIPLKQEIPNYTNESEKPSTYVLTDSYCSEWFTGDYYNKYNTYDWELSYSSSSVYAYVYNQSALINNCDKFAKNLKTMDASLEAAASNVMGGLPGGAGAMWTITNLIIQIADGTITGHDMILSAFGLIPGLGTIISASGVVSGLSLAGAAHHNYKTAYEKVVEIIRG